MATLTSTEKQVLEKLFQMGGGSVLNFSHRTLAEFFRDDLQVNISDPKYHYASGSKANLLRGFWRVADNRLVGRSIKEMLIYMDTQIDLGELRREDFSSELIDRARSTSAKLLGVTTAQASKSPDAHKSATAPK